MLHPQRLTPPAGELAFAERRRESKTERLVREGLHSSTSFAALFCESRGEEETPIFTMLLEKLWLNIPLSDGARVNEGARVNACIVG